MSKYSIGFADEEEGEIVDFANFIEEEGEFSLIPINSLGPVEDIINAVVVNNLDAMVIDFKLKQYSNKFQENGEAYLNHLMETFEKYPCFLLTNNSNDAKKYTTDPFRVISKSIINLIPENNNYEEAVQLRKDIKTIIEFYRADLTEKEETLMELLQKKHSGKSLSAIEESQVFEIDRALTNSIFRNKNHPIQFGKHEELNGLDELIKQTKELIKTLKDK